MIGYELSIINSALFLVYYTRLFQIERIPWKSIMLSVPFWSLAVGYFGQFWILGFYSTTQALYMGTILNLDSITVSNTNTVHMFIKFLFLLTIDFIYRTAKMWKSGNMRNADYPRIFLIFFTVILFFISLLLTKVYSLIK